MGLNNEEVDPKFGCLPSMQNDVTSKNQYKPTPHYVVVGSANQDVTSDPALYSLETAFPILFASLKRRRDAHTHTHTRRREKPIYQEIVQYSNSLSDGKQIRRFATRRASALGHRCVTQRLQSISTNM